jgi:hypothetical protein
METMKSRFQISILFLALFLFACTGNNETIPEPTTPPELEEELVRTDSIPGVAMFVANFQTGEVRSRVAVQLVNVYSVPGNTFERKALRGYLLRGQFHEASTDEKMEGDKLIKTAKPPYYEWDEVPPMVVQIFFTDNTRARQ